MAFTLEEFNPDRWFDSHYYKTYTITLPHTGVTDAVAPATRYKLQEIRIRWSSAFESAESIKVYVSSANGSYYNILLFSYNMNNSQDLRWYWSDPIMIFSGDQIVFYTSNISHANIAGIDVIGWAVRG